MSIGFLPQSFRLLLNVTLNACRAAISTSPTDDAVTNCVGQLLLLLLFKTGCLSSSMDTDQLNTEDHHQDGNEQHNEPHVTGKANHDGQLSDAACFNFSADRARVLVLRFSVCDVFRLDH
ncbi:hypothetical protein TYRP_010015 [Tyrophagus putrescentiae]|nr:hypothetical protein TYRP_010015 [Tyrophagus putrescentiae]